MNLSEMRSSFYYKISETSSNTGFSSAKVNSFLQEGFKEVWSYANTVWNWLIKKTKKTNPYTTVSSESSDTTLNVTSASNMESDGGQYLIVTDEVVWETVLISSISETVVTLDSDFSLQNTYEEDDYVYGNHIELPSDTFQILSVIADRVQSSEQEPIYLEQVAAKEVEINNPKMNGVSSPEMFYREGDYIYIYPIPDNSWTYTIKYLYIPSDIGESTECIMPVQYHDVLVSYALWQALLSDKESTNVSLARYYEQQFYRGLQKMVAYNSNTPNKKRYMALPEYLPRNDT